MKLSIVSTLYNSSVTVAEFLTRATMAAAAITDSFEIVVVDDGSRDDALAIAIELAKVDSRLKIVELSRNFGHHKALMTALQHASGEFCLLMDSDLEEPPEAVSILWEMLHGEGLDVVYGYQQKRDGAFLRRLGGKVAYLAFDLLLHTKIPRNHHTMRLMTRPYIDALLRHSETQIVIGGLWYITGFKQAGVAVDRRAKVTTTYSFRRRWVTLLDSITNFSEVPLVIIFYVGLAIAAATSAIMFWLILRWLTLGVGVPGWLSVMLSVWLFGGVAIFYIGVIGVYLGKVFLETKHRPFTIVRKVHQTKRRG